MVALDEHHAGSASSVNTMTDSRAPQQTTGKHDTSFSALTFSHRHPAINENANGVGVPEYLLTTRLKCIHAFERKTNPRDVEFP